MQNSYGVDDEQDVDPDDSGPMTLHELDEDERGDEHNCVECGEPDSECTCEDEEDDGLAANYLDEQGIARCGLCDRRVLSDGRCPDCDDVEVESDGGEDFDVG